MTNKPLTLGVAAAVLIGTGLSAPPAHAQFTVTLTQEGPDVLANGEGEINGTGLSLIATRNPQTPRVIPNTGLIFTGTAASTHLYTANFIGGISGPTNFGSGALTSANASLSTGLLFGIAPRDDIVSVFPYPGGMVTNSSTWDNATFSSLGVEPGTYKWTWGSGATAGSFTLQVGAAAATPEPATLGLMVLGLLGAGFVGRKRRN